ncbi:MAG: ribokinase, partial [Crenarchaeota archaeon]|nr:ribokinase [Thermoproteota archaeon]
HIPGYKVPVVDTTGAGDSFTGSLAAFLDSGLDIMKSLEYANAVGALTVQKNGAIPSLPNYNEVLNFLKHN